MHKDYLDDERETILETQQDLSFQNDFIDRKTHENTVNTLKNALYILLLFCGFGLYLHFNSLKSSNDLDTSTELTSASLLAMIQEQSLKIEDLQESTGKQEKLSRHVSEQQINALEAERLKLKESLKDKELATIMRAHEEKIDFLQAENSRLRSAMGSKPPDPAVTKLTSEPELMASVESQCPIYNLTDTPTLQGSKTIHRDCSWVKNINPNGQLCFIGSYDKYYINWVLYFTMFALKAYPDALVFLTRVHYEHDPETGTSNKVKDDVFEAMRNLGINMSQVIQKDSYLQSIKGMVNIANIYRLLEIPDPRCEFVYITDMDLALTSINDNLIDMGIAFMEKTCLPYSNQVRELFRVNKECDEKSKGTGDRLTGINHFMHAPRYVELFSCAMKEAKQILERGDLVDWCCAKLGFCDEHLLYNILATDKDGVLPRKYCDVSPHIRNSDTSCYQFKSEELCMEHKDCYWSVHYQNIHGIHYPYQYGEKGHEMYAEKGPTDQFHKKMTTWILRNMKVPHPIMKKAEEIFSYYCKQYTENFDALVAFDKRPLIRRSVEKRVRPFVETMCPIEEFRRKSSSWFNWTTFEFIGTR